ncbi:MAG: YckD family protein [Firmicutes bacterium]|nr:YckD family protein [Bacillota bacterium]
MKKWLALGLTVVALALVALPVLAQDNESQLAELEDLYNQLTTIKKQIADVRVEMGQITPEQGTAIKERADEHYNWVKENNFQCPGYGLGGLRGGQGRGPGNGARFQGMGCPFAPPSSSTQE